MNKIIKTKSSFSLEYLKKENQQIKDILKNINDHDTIIINDNNLFSYIDIIKSLPNKLTKVILTYHLNNDKNIILKNLNELSNLTNIIKEIQNSVEYQSAIAKTGITSFDKINILNNFVENKITNEFQIENIRNLEKQDFSSDNQEIVNFINNLNFDNFIPKLKPKLTKEILVQKLNKKLGFPEDFSYQKLREKYVNLYRSAAEVEKPTVAEEAQFHLNKYQLYLDRVDEEWDVSNKFIDYIYFVSYITDTIKNNGYNIGAGRGSAPSSLICWTLGITEIDPIEFKLDFSRFLNKYRIGYPDIDIDIPAEIRNDIYKLFPDYEFIKIQTMSGINIETQIKNLWESKQGNIPVFDIRKDKDVIILLKKLLQNIRNNPDLENQAKENLAKVLTKTQGINKINSNKIEMLIKQIKNIQKKCDDYTGTSVHASGYVIVEKDKLKFLEKFVTFSKTSTGLVIQAPQDTLEKIGIQKFDLLSLSYLDIINNSKKMITNYKEINYRAIGISENDEQTNKTINSLKNYFNKSLFQVESGNIQIVLMRVVDEWVKNNPTKKTLIELISDIIAIIRPGVVQNNIDLDYINSFKDQEPAFLNLFKKDLNIYQKINETCPDGMVIYQEQIMALVKSFGVEDADNFRRAISKKDVSKIEQMRNIFIETALKQNNNYDQTLLNTLFDSLEKYSKYCFNKSHSISYARIFLETAHLFANHTKEYAISYINKQNSIENILNIIKECSERNIKIRPQEMDKNTEHYLRSDEIIINLNKLPSTKDMDKKEVVNRAIMIGKNIGKISNWQEKIFADPSYFSNKVDRAVKNIIFDHNNLYFLTKKEKVEGYNGVYYKYNFGNKILFDNRNLNVNENKYYKLKLNEDNNKILEINEASHPLKKSFINTFVLSENGKIFNPLNRETINLNITKPISNGLNKIEGDYNGLTISNEIITSINNTKKTIKPIKLENTMKIF